MGRRRRAGCVTFISAAALGGPPALYDFPPHSNAWPSGRGSVYRGGSPAGLVPATFAGCERLVYVPDLYAMNLLA